MVSFVDFLNIGKKRRIISAVVADNSLEDLAFFGFKLAVISSID
jgi:hypothetical protein